MPPYTGSNPYLKKKLMDLRDARGGSGGPQLGQGYTPLMRDVTGPMQPWGGSMPGQGGQYGGINPGGQPPGSDIGTGYSPRPMPPSSGMGIPPGKFPNPGRPGQGGQYGGINPGGMPLPGMEPTPEMREDLQGPQKRPRGRNMNAGRWDQATIDATRNAQRNRWMKRNSDMSAGGGGGFLPDGGSGGFAAPRYGPRKRDTRSRF